MNVLIRYNGWSRIEDVSTETIRSGAITLCIMPPFDLDCEPVTPVQNLSANLLTVYHTGKCTDNGLLVFSNTP